MEDFFVGSLALLVCGAPVAALIGIAIFYLRKAPRDPRVDELELEVARLRGDLQLLAARLPREGMVAASVAQPVALAAPVAAAPVAEAPPAVEAEPEDEDEDEDEAEPEVDAEPEVAPAAAPAPAFASGDDWGAVVAEAPPPAAPPPAAPPPAAPPPAASPPYTPPYTPPPRPVAQEGGLEGGLERWLGVRGAAALGAVVLVIAGFYFFQYSISHGLIGPLMRVVLGTLVGLVTIGLSEWPLRKRSPVLSNALAGAGVAILYITFWASNAVFHLVPLPVAGGLFALVTATCVTLAIRRDALSIAALGLLGGFATPFVLSTGQDKPVSLFTYLLLLDVALLFVARKKRWPLLAVGSLAATALYQLLWLFGRMDSGRTWLGVAIVVVFGALFALFPLLLPAKEGEPAPDRTTTTAIRIGAVALPFFLALSFAGRAHLGEQLWETGALVVVLSLGAAFVARRESAEWVALGAAGGALGILGLWALQHHLVLGTTWQLTATLALVAGAHHASLEFGRGEPLTAWLAAAAATLGGLALLALASTGLEATAGVTPYASLAPYVVGFALLAALAVRQAGFEGRSMLHVALALALPIALALLDGICSALGSFPEGLPTGLAVLASVALTAVAVVRRKPDARAHADYGAALAAVIALFALTAHSSSFAAWTYLAACALLASLTLLAAARCASGVPATLGLFAVTIAFSARTAVVPGRAPLLVDLVVMGGTVLVFALWPLAAGPRYRAHASAWRAAALPGLALFLPMRVAWLRTFGDDYLGALAVALAAVALAAAFLARSHGPSDRDERRSSIVWLAAATATFVTLAIPLQLGNEWLTIGWALEAVALLALDRRLDHAGLRWLSMALFAAVATRLLVNPYVLGYYTRGDLRIVNWLAYTYLVPAACLLAGWWLLRTVEVERRRPWEAALLPAWPVLAPTLAATALLAIFAWLNLAIIDWFASGPQLSIPTERLPARDLTMSIVWALYALSLLGVGLWRGSTAARFASLGLLLITCGKVFLYDLGHLRDLYRVAALVGLAFSLLFVSLVYSRLLFRRAAAESEGKP